MYLIARRGSRISRLKVMIGALAATLTLTVSLQAAVPDLASARMTQREYCIALIDGKAYFNDLGLPAAVKILQSRYDELRCGGRLSP